MPVTKIRLAASEDRAFARWAGLFSQARRRRIKAEQLGATQVIGNMHIEPWALAVYAAWLVF